MKPCYETPAIVATVNVLTATRGGTPPIGEGLVSAHMPGSVGFGL